MDMPKDKRFKDLIGKTFGRLLVLEYSGKRNTSQHQWLCKCHCGSKKFIGGNELKRGKTKSCGCYHKEVTEQARENLTGQIFGRYTVISYAGAKWPNKKSKGHQWLCQCKCGKKKIVMGMGLKSGKTTSCGCYHKEQTSKARLIDLTGNKYGRLTVIERVGCKNNQPTWLCKCECGNEKVISGNSLTYGNSKSCGCRQGQFKHGLWGTPEYRKYYLSDPAKRLRHYVGTRIRTALKATNGSKQGKSVFDVLPYTPEELKKYLESLWEPWMSWNNYGGPNNSKKKTWHIDHIIPQSRFYYTSLEEPAFLECWDLRNLRPLEKIANMQKSNKILV
jgi:hypothetical protein